MNQTYIEVCLSTASKKSQVYTSMTDFFLDLGVSYDELVASEWKTSKRLAYYAGTPRETQKFVKAFEVELFCHLV